MFLWDRLECKLLQDTTGGKVETTEVAGPWATPSHDGLSLSPPEVVFGVSLVPISEYLVPVAQEGGKYPYSFHDMTF